MDAIQMQMEGNHLAKVLPFTYFIKWWNLNACEWRAQTVYSRAQNSGLQELKGSSSFLPRRSPRAGWPQTRCLLLRLASLLQTAILSLPWIRGGAFGQLAALKPSPNKCWCCGGRGWWFTKTPGPPAVLFLFTTIELSVPAAAVSICQCPSNLTPQDSTATTDCHKAIHWNQLRGQG